jgi:hypothetical protein
VADVHRLPSRTSFVDDRGVGLRATWHAEREVIVLSIWRGEQCTGSFRLPVSDAARLANVLLTSVSEWAAIMAPPKAVNGD